MPKRVEIGPEAQRVMVQCFWSQKPATMIAAIVEQETGEQIAVRTIERRAAAWRAEQSRLKAGQEQMDALVKAMKANDAAAPEMIQALALQALIMDPDAFAKSDPIKVQRQNLRAEELRIKAATLALKERQIAVDETKLRMLQEREQRAVAALEGKGEAMTPEERMRKIREIYGLGDVKSEA